MPGMKLLRDIDWRDGNSTLPSMIAAQTGVDLVIADVPAPGRFLPIASTTARSTPTRRLIRISIAVLTILLRSG